MAGAHADDAEDQEDGNERHADDGHDGDHVAVGGLALHIVEEVVPGLVADLLDDLLVQATVVVPRVVQLLVAAEGGVGLLVDESGVLVRSRVDDGQLEEKARV